MNRPIQSEKRATLLRTEGDVAFLRLEDGQDLRWPVMEIPEPHIQGAEIRLRLLTPASDAADRNALAMEVLNELLRPSATGS
jgi:hypothetical protein